MLPVVTKMLVLPVMLGALTVLGVKPATPKDRFTTPFLGERTICQNCDYQQIWRSWCEKFQKQSFGGDRACEHGKPRTK